MIRVTVISILVSLIFVRCSSSQSETTQDYESENFPQPKVAVEYSENFQIGTSNGFQVLKINDPITKSVKSYTLVPKGMASPDSENVIYTPVDQLSLYSVSFIGYLSELDGLDRVKYIENINYVFNPYVIKSFEDGKIMESGMFGQMNLEKLILDSPELILLNDFPESSDYLNKLMKAGVQVCPILEWQEQHPLARAEWIKVFGALLDKEEEASAIFEEIELAYTKESKKHQHDTLNVQAIFSAPYEGVWYMPGGESYIAHILSDAGGSYAWEDTPDVGSLSLSFEEIILTSLKNDVWINPDANSLSELYVRDGRFKKLVDNLSIGVYQSNKRRSSNGGNDYWESGVVRPDLILKDYVNMLNPDLSDAELYYFNKLN